MSVITSWWPSPSAPRRSWTWRCSPGLSWPSGAQWEAAEGGGPWCPPLSCWGWSLGDVRAAGKIFKLLCFLAMSGKLSTTFVFLSFGLNNILEDRTMLSLLSLGGMCSACVTCHFGFKQNHCRFSWNKIILKNKYIYCLIKDVKILKFRLPQILC